jgi:hypothetical protein
MCCECAKLHTANVEDFRVEVHGPFIQHFLAGNNRDTVTVGVQSNVVVVIIIVVALVLL